MSGREFVIELTGANRSMKERIARVVFVLVLVALGTVLLTGAEIRLGIGSGGAAGAAAPPVRSIELEAREAAFSGTNPTIKARVGEKLRFVVRNTDDGVLHSITVPELTDEVEHVKWGETGVLEVTVDQAGTFLYTCPQHCPKMRGEIVVKP